VAEHQKQQATVAGLVPAALRRLDQLFNLSPGEVLPVAVVIRRPASVRLFSSPWFDYVADTDTVLRAKGWAVLFAVTLLDTGIQVHPRQANPQVAAGNAL